MPDKCERRSTFRSNDSVPILSYARINVKPEGGGGGPRADVGHLTSMAFPTLGNLTKNLGPRLGKFAFYARRNETKSRHPTRPDFVS